MKPKIILSEYNGLHNDTTVANVIINEVNRFMGTNKK